MFANPLRALLVDWCMVCGGKGGDEFAPLLAVSEDFGTLKIHQMSVEGEHTVLCGEKYSKSQTLKL